MVNKLEYSNMTFVRDLDTKATELTNELEGDFKKMDSMNKTYNNAEYSAILELLKESNKI